MDEVVKADEKQFLEVDEYQHNHELVLEAWEDIYKTTKKRPTQVAISKRTGLTRQTVARHLKDSNFEVDIAPKHVMNINPVLDEFYDVLQHDDLTPYQKGKLIIEYVKLIGNPTHKSETKQTSQSNVLKVSIIKNDDKKDAKDVEITEIISEDGEN